MKVLERPAGGGLTRVPEPRGTVYYAAGLDVERFAGVFAQLQLNARCIEPADLVDVKAPQLYLLNSAVLSDAELLRTIEALHGDLAAAIALTDDGATAVPQWLFGLLEEPVDPAALAVALRSALRQIGLHERARRAQMDLDRRAAQMADLHHVGVALSAEKDADALQSLILSKARGITSADAGSLYLVVEDEQVAVDDAGQPLLDADGNPILTRVKVLAFNKAQNFSNPSDFKAFRMPLNTGIAGYVATTGAMVQHLDLYDLPPDLPYTFNRDFDLQTGYRSKSMLAVPMINSDNEVVGVIQLINRKYRPDVKLTAENIEREVLPFSLEDRDLTLSFASQAAVALDNRRLIESIQTLFEGFVRASVQAIESRDPTTSGHSERVAALTVGLAQAVNAIERGEWTNVHFGEDALREIRYAALLHDFGKVGVREHVLIKAKKLYDWQIEEIRGRFGVARAALESAMLRRKMDYLQAHGAAGSEAALAAMDAELERHLALLEASYQVVRSVNEPNVVAEDQRAQLDQLGGLTYQALSGPEPLLEPRELRRLAIQRGSLDEDERAEIESHVTHTYKFLTKIPWTHDLRRVPEIAWAHHERLDGSGYPNRLVADQIPLQSKMMAIADIYDALTAWDRPYKKALPVEKALLILLQEAKSGHVDSDLLDIFIGKGVYKSYP
ncbi:MAG TPA: HD domain-containing phosphohydrolase [Chloroflexota bacterium]|nr:HD domain-containing phosphohydrolase [Chloroflexota bacterium]